jgi:23S rRNA (guanosine2251-2'-O)-methyltransferase
LVLDERRAFPELAALARAAGVTCEQGRAADLERLAGDVPARGVVAVADPPPLVPLDVLIADALEPGAGPLVALDGVTDPHNLGAILRSAEFFGAVGALWPRDRAAGVTPTVVRASAGATERLPLCEVTNLAAALTTCRGAGVWVLGTVVQGGTSLARLCAEDRVPTPLCVVFGSEGQGLRRLTRDRCDLLVTIGGRGELASLNVSAAAAVVLASLHAVVGS